MDVSLSSTMQWFFVRSHVLFVMLLGFTVLCGIAVHKSSLAQIRATREIGLRIIVVGSATEAREIVDLLKKGKDFATLAKQRSTDPTAAEGGFMGRLDPATLRSELRDAVKDLAPGQLTDMVKIPSGYAVLKVESESAVSQESSEQQTSKPSGMLPISSRGNVRYPPDVAGAVDGRTRIPRISTGLEP
jgi:hypothetical protein